MENGKRTVRIQYIHNIHMIIINIQYIISLQKNPIILQYSMYCILLQKFPIIVPDELDIYTRKIS